nr:MAG TPA: hypothetical protein [Caudoviricetes sp.]
MARYLLIRGAKTWGSKNGARCPCNVKKAYKNRG